MRYEIWAEPMLLGFDKKNKTAFYFLFDVSIMYSMCKLKLKLNSIQAKPSHLKLDRRSLIVTYHCVQCTTPLLYYVQYHDKNTIVLIMIKTVHMYNVYLYLCLLTVCKLIVCLCLIVSQIFIQVYIK